MCDLRALTLDCENLWWHLLLNFLLFRRRHLLRFATILKVVFWIIQLLTLLDLIFNNWRYLLSFDFIRKWFEVHPESLWHWIEFWIVLKEFDVVFAINHFQFLQLFLFLLSKRWHNRWPKFRYLWSCSTVFNRSLRFKYKIVKFCWIGFLAEDLACNDAWVQKLLQYFGHCILHHRELHDNSSLRVLHPVGRELFGCSFKHFNWQFLNGEMIDIQYNNPLFDLTWHQHVSVYITCKKVVQRSKAVLTYQVFL